MTFIITLQKPVTKRQNPCNYRVTVVANADNDREARDKVYEYLSAHNRIDHYILESRSIEDVEIVKA